MSELPGASPPGPPPGLCPGPAGELTAPPRPPAVCSNDLRLLRVTMIDGRQLYLALLPYEGIALNLIDIKSAVLDLRRKPCISSILFKKIWARLKN